MRQRRHTATRATRVHDAEENVDLPQSAASAAAEYARAEFESRHRSRADLSGAPRRRRQAAELRGSRRRSINAAALARSTGRGRTQRAERQSSALEAILSPAAQGGLPHRVERLERRPPAALAQTTRTPRCTAAMFAPRAAPPREHVQAQVRSGDIGSKSRTSRNVSLIYVHPREIRPSPGRSVARAVRPLGHVFRRRRAVRAASSGAGRSSAVDSRSTAARASHLAHAVLSADRLGIRQRDERLLIARGAAAGRWREIFNARELARAATSSWCRPDERRSTSISRRASPSSIGRRRTSRTRLLRRRRGGASSAKFERSSRQRGRFRASPPPTSIGDSRPRARRARARSSRGGHRRAGRRAPLVRPPLPRSR